MSINILDSLIINRISAGEVVESTFSIVKELIDNSLDAGADKILVEIKNGGIDQIIVKDNGCGIGFEDIKKAFLPHATSKIKNIDDLDEITTLGFRGEALASISNVSQTIMKTRTASSDCGYTIDVDGGKFSEIEPISFDVGTMIEVNNLFYNTPARRKFLKKPKQEENQITNIISRYILAHPNISFKYVVDGKTVYQTKGYSLLDAIYCVYGDEFTQNIMSVEKVIGDYKLTGFVSKIGYSKPNTTYQTLMINSRFVVDETVSKAAYMAFEEYLMHRQFPVYVLNLEMPASEVDVNVHPSKMNVKFASNSKVYELVYSAIRAAIYDAINPKTAHTTEEITKDELNPQDSLIKIDVGSLKEIEIEPTLEFDYKPPVITLKQETFSPVTIFDLPKKEESQIQSSNSRQAVEKTLLNNEGVNNADFVDVKQLTDFKIVGELFNEFILLEKGDDMIIMDFHAGHERLNYDKFSEMVKNRNVVVQDLLVPYIQDLSLQEVEFIMSLKEDLNKLGFDIDEFGDRKIKINSVPMQLKDINLKNFVDDLIHDIKNLKPSMNNEINNYLMQKACKSSVKSGMKLSEHEINELLKNLDMKHPVLLCPHGRPVITVVKKNQIEKWFKRIV